MLVPLVLLVSPALAGEAGSADVTNKGIVVADASGKNKVTFGFSFQPRLTATLAGDPDAADADAVSDAGVRVRRMLFTANGTLADRVDVRFRIDAAKSLAFADGDGKDQLAARPVLDDAQVVVRLAESVGLSVGQWKVPFTDSQMMSDTTLLFPDRPLPIDGLKYGDVKLTGFSHSRDAGVALLGDFADHRLEAQLGAFNGDGANVFPTADEGYLAVARVQVAPLGEFKYDEVDFERGEPRLAVGAAATYEATPAFDDAGDRDGGTGELRVGGELRFAASGFSVNAEGLYGLVTPSEGDPTRLLGAYGVVGYYLPVGLAPAVRVSRLDPSLDAEDDGVTSVEAALNVYLPSEKEGKNLGHKGQLQLAWTTNLLDGADHPLSHQVQLATAFGF